MDKYLSYLKQWVLRCPLKKERRKKEMNKTTHSVSNIDAETRRVNVETKREKNSASMQHIARGRC